VFAEHLGTSPGSIAQTRRLHFAKRLIVETRLPMTEIAFASGYQNVRRFNAEIRRVFQTSPREMRSRGHRGATANAGSRIVLAQSLRTPFDWDALLAFLAPRAHPGVEEVAGGAFRRTVEVDDLVAVLEVSRQVERRTTSLHLSVPAAATPYLGRIVPRVRALFDLDADPAVIGGQLETDADLRALVRKRPGLRVPGAWDRFETAVRAILGQQVSVGGATTLAGRLVRAFGRPIPDDVARPETLTHTFPRPDDLADADIASIGLPKARAESIRALARSVCDGQPVLETALDLETALGRLVALPGIGDWTAQYISMRALREPDAFPAGDLGLRKALAAGAQLPTPAALTRRSESWRPWRAYAAMWLWASLS
jgi:AraC family transcriptional regulator of adaptative response / DNA-3-methyladenine glycosylase II